MAAASHGSAGHSSSRTGTQTVSEGACHGRCTRGGESAKSDNPALLVAVQRTA